MSKPRNRTRALHVALAAVILGVLVAPFAIAANGDGLRVGVRNPTGTGETKIIGNNSTWGTRQSNVNPSDGGGAIYGCRAPQGQEACIKAQNIRAGRAFEFRSDQGTLGGLIHVGAGGDSAKPFTTNATGVATGLNADEVDGKSATEIVDDAKALNQFASVTSGGSLEAGARGATAAVETAGAGNYRVTFAADVSKCARTATAQDLDSGAVTVAPVAGQPTQIDVRTRDAGGAQADRPFHLLVTC